MVVNDAVELGIVSRDMAEALKHALLSTQLRRQANQEEDLGSSDTSPLLVTIKRAKKSGLPALVPPPGGKEVVRLAPVHRLLIRGGAVLRNSRFLKWWPRGWSTQGLSYALEEKYLLPTGYKFIVPDADATVNKPSHRLGGSPGLNNGKPIRSLFGEPIAEETKTAHYFQYYLREDDHPKAIPSFMSRIVDGGKEPERKWSRCGKCSLLGQATEQQIAAKNKRCYKEARHRRVETQARKAPKLALASRRTSAVSVNLPQADTCKRPRTKEGHDVAATSTSTPLRVEPPPSKAVDPSVKYTFVENLTKTWALAPSRSVEPPKVTEGQVALVEALKVVGSTPSISALEKRILNLQAECQKSEEFTAKYKRRLEKVKKEKEALETEKGDLNAIWKRPILKQRPRPRRELKKRLRPSSRATSMAEGRNPELVDFIPPATDKDNLGDEETTPLDGGAASSDGESREDEAHGDSDDDEDLDIWRIGFELKLEQAVGTSTTKNCTSKFLALTLSPKRRGSRIFLVGLTSYPPEPRIGWTKGITSLPGYLSFFRQSQVMMSTELLVSIRILRTMVLATFISITSGSLCREAKCWPSSPPNTMVGTVTRLPYSAVRTCRASRSCAV
ncbi:hypothetical protein Cgig2_011944 [Carnegiea gigantea]|uniref:Uncharacterized protein n=1 Tax=Carnegiea gigantea TaxID=171969 RepID=A0A9Q1JFH7_9CARY|nr:hypothetical protein Cgig2_011944 [Carnegiea gigantea]